MSKKTNSLIFMVIATIVNVVILLVFCVVGRDDSVTFIEARGRGVSVAPELLAEIDRVLGTGNYRLKARPYDPPPRRAWNREKAAAPAGQ